MGDDHALSESNGHIFHLAVFYLQPAMATIASATELYRQCAVTLLKAERYQDTLTVCDKLLTTSDWRLNKSKQGINHILELQFRLFCCFDPSK